MILFDKILQSMIDLLVTLTDTLYLNIQLV